MTSNFSTISNEDSIFSFSRKNYSLTRSYSNSFSSSMSHSISSSPSPDLRRSFGPRRMNMSLENHTKVCKSPDRHRKSNKYRRTMGSSIISQSPDSEFIETMCHIDSALPSFYSQKNEMKYISLETLSMCIENQMNIMIVDCRYYYEYDAGHLKGALNLWTEELLFTTFPVENRKFHCNAIILFYCEFSEMRAPELALKLRKADQYFSSDGNLLYNNIFIINGGAEALFQQMNHKCIGDYLSMTNEACTEALLQASCLFSSQASLVIDK